MFWISSGNYPEMELLGHIAVLLLILWGDFHTVSHSGRANLQSHSTVHNGSLCSTCLRSLVVHMSILTALHANFYKLIDCRVGLTYANSYPEAERRFIEKWIAYKRKPPRHRAIFSVYIASLSLFSRLSATALMISFPPFFSVGLISHYNKSCWFVFFSSAPHAFMIRIKHFAVLSKSTTLTEQIMFLT